MRDCFLKFSKKSGYLHDFVKKGHIYVNTAEYFTDCESESNGQNDKFEMATSYHQNEGALINIDGRNFKITKPFCCREGEPPYTHIFCLYAISDESINRSDYNKVFDEKLWNEFGENFVFIYDAHSFMERLTDKLKEMNVTFKADYVDYFCTDTYEGPVGPFKKRNIYSHQEEYRVAISMPQIDGPITNLYLGNISDISYGPVHRKKSRNTVDETGVTL